MIEPDENNDVPAPVRRRRRGIYLLPNLLTTGALFSGFYAVIAAIDGNYIAAAIAIYVAIILDGLDGRVARMTSTESDFGKEYDSLSDMVAFGVAPAIVVYQWGVARLAEYGTAWGRLGWIAAFLYVVAAALRLARFNTRIASADKRFFDGLPSPSAAALVGGLVWLGTVQGIDGLPALLTAFVITVLAGLCMVSAFHYYSFKDFNLGGRVRFTHLLLIPATFMLISLNPPVVLFLGFLLYACSGPALWFWRRRRRSSSATDSRHGEEAPPGDDG
ncbi:MAG: CDP-diacylglycerol--serine O-phosphatidyltransferase [Gammaproteobacteria bacterium]|nr:CDP-diacylglycerol--serine O-phosphatidyltransferase [Gammaproteobacteria bacterium]TVQ46713.1 MAG: CDP-diacylglycerol--serine O-phosphatidyltransferase [Gammaproteobacteria bacterium]